MSTIGEVFIKPTNGANEQSWTGFSWPCLLFGVFWFGYKRLYGWALISFIAAIASGGISWILFPFFANGLHSSSLNRSGWLLSSQASDFVVTPDTHIRCPDCRELVRNDARICKHCRCALIPQTEP